MFAKYCQGKDSDVSVGPIDSGLPHTFDATRRTSVSAECWAAPPDPLCCLQELRSTRCTTNKQRDPNVLRSTNSQSTSNGTPSMGCLSEDSKPETEENSIFSEATPEMKVAYQRAVCSLRQTIFFEELSDNLMNDVLHALDHRLVPAGVEVIKQGDEGNELFILDEGSVAFYIDGVKCGEASNGATFGELALLYNSPRAASVFTQSPSKLFTLDRVTFKRIMVAKLSEKRRHSQEVLASIDVFSHIPDSLRLRISDALHPVSFKKGDVVLREGDIGRDFYLIDEGTVNVTKDGKLLNSYGSGMYFGELALIYDLPRAATITATSDTLKLEVLSKTGFEQLIGPDLVAELRRRDPRKA